MLGGQVPDDKAVDRIFNKLDADGQPAKRWRVREFSCLLIVACWCRTLCALASRVSPSPPTERRRICWRASTRTTARG
jgi:hypothetical protein